jgi:transcriptional regulator with XRE-family HTH domain
LEARSPSIEMLQRIAKALNMDPLDLFSKKALSVDLVRDFYDAVLSDFEEVLERHISNFEKKISNSSS